MPRSLRLPIAALLAAAVVAEGAVLLLRPRDAGPDPLALSPRAYFTAAQVERAKDFRDGQTLIYFAQVAVGLVVLGALVARPPAVLRRRRRRQVLAGALAGAGISVVLTVAGLPLAAVARERAKDVGLITQDWTGWAGDVVKSTAIGALTAGAGGALLVVGLRRLGRRWWIPGTVAVVAYAVAITYLGPVLLDPVFNKFTPVPQGRLRSEVLDLARRAGVDVGQVYEMDASRRTTAANAYVNGIGRTKRVVIYDTLLHDFTPAEVRSVVAHELGHVHYHDVRNGLIWVAIVAPFGLWAVARIGERLTPQDAPLAAAVPAVALALAIVVPVVTGVSNQLSRRVERRADAFALRLTHEPDALIALQKRFTAQNVSDPDPPAWLVALLATHPTTMQRIGQAEAFRAGGA